MIHFETDNEDNSMQALQVKALIINENREFKALPVCANAC